LDIPKKDLKENEKEIKWKEILSVNKYWESVFPVVLIKNIKERWSLTGNSIDKKP